MLDPACGHGNFLVEVVRRKIQHGSTPLQALQTTYGIEIMEDTAEWCRERLVKIAMDEDASQPEAYRLAVDKNIVCADALTYDYSFGEDPEPEQPAEPEPFSLDAFQMPAKRTGRSVR